MTLLECLNQLPDDMKMIDLTEVDGNKKIKTVAEIKQSLKRDEHGYEIRERKVNYGKAVKVSIGIIGGFNIFNQV
jgi:hypothetical protein